jgi:hypothetical protein
VPEQTPEQIGREAGATIANTIADALEAPLLRMAEVIATLKTEQGELRDELSELAADYRQVYGAYMAHLRKHHGGDA